MVGKSNVIMLLHKHWRSITLFQVFEFLTAVRIEAKSLERGLVEHLAAPMI